MTTPLFSTYRQGENRVTSTLLAVLQRLSLPNIDRILRALLDDEGFNLVAFENQPKLSESTPDARIATGSSILVETKTARNAVNNRQLNHHLGNARPGEKLVLLTPDSLPPPGLDSRIIWSNFKTLVGVVEEILGDDTEPPSENESFLLREFIRMLRQDGLLDSTESRVIVLAARHAWPMYERLSVYECGPDKPMRALRDSDYLAFYVAGKIQRLAPRILSVLDNIDLTKREEVEALEVGQRGRAEELLERIDYHKERHLFSRPRKVMFLSGPTDGETVKLAEPIVNDKEDKNGNPTPFTFGAPRYVTLKSLQKATRTSQLEFC